MTMLLHALGIFAAQNPAAVYASFYVAVIFLGNIGIFAGLLIVTEGNLGPWGILFFIATVFAAEISGDLVWYALGKVLCGTHVGTFLKNHIPRHEKIEAHLQKNSRRWIFLSKFLYLTTFPIIFMVGWSRVKFKEFFRVSLIAIFSAVPVVLLIALLLIRSVNYLQATRIFHKFEWLFVFAFAAFVACDILFAKTVKRYVKRRIAENASG